MSGRFPSAAALRHALGDVEHFSRHIVGRPLRPYQLEPARAVLASVFDRRGLSITVEMARQAGKNELSAQLEAYLLTLCQRSGGNLIKCAPTFKPQVVNSKLRLEQTLANPLTTGRFAGEWSYMVRLGRARAIFFSAEPSARVVGATAHLLLEFDEAQDIDPDKHDKDFVPMGATTNVSKVYYGTAWDETTLLEREKRRNLESQARDGVRRHFEYPWEVVAEHNPLYGRYVESERDRLGEEHPLFKTQYRLQPISGEGGFLTARHRAQLVGDHPRLHAPLPGLAYVAGVDVAGADEEAVDAVLRAARPRKDSTVVTIAQVETAPLPGGVAGRLVRLVDHYWWTGRGHVQQYRQLLDLLGQVWRCRRVCVDASGLGAGVAAFLATALGSTVVEPVVFSAASKSELGFALLAAVNSGQLKMYAEAAGGQPGWVDTPSRGYPAYSPEAREFWLECERSRYTVRANQQIGFYVPEREGHDDFLSSLALAVRAASQVTAAPAAAVLDRPPDYEDGRY